MRFPSFLIAALLTLPSAATQAQSAPPEAGVSHALAIARAAQLSDIRYNLEFNVREHATTIDGAEKLSFSSTTAGDLAIDYRDGQVLSVGVNGQAIPINAVNGHLILPVIAGRNMVTIAFVSNAAPAGKSITRYTDKDDGKEYFYTLFVPMDASMAFPCFDQPDLKARFTLSVDHPASWTVIANTAPGVDTSGGQDERFTFPETHPISTYLFAFAAGPWQKLPGHAPGEPAVFVRASQLKRAQQEAPQVQQIAARGIAWLSDYFQQPFPFPKYDLVLIPGFPFGGMEHAGATFLNEDGVLFRSTPTASDYFRRDILVLHETTHQWFGDLVTMRWFDDLWLKEGFAQYMAYKAMNALEPATNPWKHFFEEIKPAAYAIDETQGTTPIYQVIPNLKDAKSAYGAIVYQKAPAVLKQLNYVVGDQVFRDGLRRYLKEHAYANAEWSDLIAALGRAGADDDFTHVGGAKPPLAEWATAWIKQRGMPEVHVAWSCAGGKLMAVTLTQHDVLGTPATWPIASELFFASATSEQRVRVDWSGATATVPAVAGRACPIYVFANSGDEAYGRFLLDPVSEHSLAPPRVESDGSLSPISAVADPLLRSELYGALWANVRNAVSSPASFVRVALEELDNAKDESLVRTQGARVVTAFHFYMNADSPNNLRALAYGIVREKMFEAPSLDLRITYFRLFVSLADHPRALSTLQDLLDGKDTIPGLQLRPLDRWNMIGRLIEMNVPEAHRRFLTEQARDKSGEAQKYAYAVAAGVPSTDTKTAYFDDYLHNTTLQEDWITQSLGYFNAWNQSGATFPFLTRALDELPEIKLHRKIFFLGAWLNAFIGGQHSPEAQAAVQAWLAKPGIDPDLRLKVLEVSDGLDRTVRIRQRFPE
jgi:aminopeptidase N